MQRDRWGGGGARGRAKALPGGGGECLRAKGGVLWGGNEWSLAGDLCFWDCPREGGRVIGSFLKELAVRYTIGRQV